MVLTIVAKVQSEFLYFDHDHFLAGDFGGFRCKIKERLIRLLGKNIINQYNPGRVTCSSPWILMARRFEIGEFCLTFV